MVAQEPESGSPNMPLTLHNGLLSSDAEFVTREIAFLTLLWERLRASRI